MGARGRGDRGGAAAAFKCPGQADPGGGRRCKLVPGLKAPPTFQKFNLTVIELNVVYELAPPYTAEIAGHVRIFAAHAPLVPEVRRCKLNTRQLVSLTPRVESASVLTA